MMICETSPAYLAVPPTLSRIVDCRRRSHHRRRAHVEGKRLIAAITIYRQGSPSVHRQQIALVENFTKQL